MVQLCGSTIGLGVYSLAMENNQGETINDIHNYLASFNKEIQSSAASGKNVAQVFVDENGQYYYHAVDGEEMVIMESPEKGVEVPIDIKKIKQSASPAPSDDQSDELDIEEKEIGITAPPLRVLPSVNHSDENGHVILNSGDNNQIVTIVPSSNPGEVSYVLIVEQSAENDKDETVYDFNEVDEGLTYVSKDSNDEDDKKMIRMIPKKSQTITPVHMCNYCNYTSSKRYLLARHMRCHSEERPHKCAVCERGFKTLASLQNHLNTHTGIKPHKCKFCESTFTTSGELVRHVRYIHTHEKPHKCTDCSYASVELSKLKRHMRCHTGERPYQCPHCTYASPDTFKLKRHLRIHTGEKPYQCDICNARFTQSNSLKAHKMIHTGSKPVYNCDLCPTTCGRKTDLRIHIQKLHTSDKPLKCKKCGKAFPDRYTYKQHNKSHEGEKCFKCDLCSYASAAARHLESHMLIHTEQKPFKCRTCDQSFRQKQLLKRHQNLYHNPLYIPPVPREKTQECPECNKAFRHKGNLIRHMALHDPDASPQDKVEALKASRQRRLELINGEEVEVFSGDVDEEMMTVQGQDGNQYVVLEVIQLQDGDGHVMMSEAIPDPSLDASAVLSSSSLLMSGNISAPSTIDSQTSLLDISEDKKPTLKIELPDDPKKDVQKEMDSCFGFDDDEDPSQMNLSFGE